jgi:hypothetical protein
MWDFRSPAPPTENVAPPWNGPDPHGGPGADARARQMVSDFVQPDGSFIDVCNGGPCQSDVLGSQSARKPSKWPVPPAW